MGACASSGAVPVAREVPAPPPQTDVPVAKALAFSDAADAADVEEDIAAHNARVRAERVRKEKAAEAAFLARLDRDIPAAREAALKKAVSENKEFTGFELSTSRPDGLTVMGAVRALHACRAARGYRVECTNWRVGQDPYGEMKFEWKGGAAWRRARVGYLVPSTRHGFTHEWEES